MPLQESFYQYDFRMKVHKKTIKLKITDLFHKITKYMTSMQCVHEIVGLETDYHVHVYKANSFLSP